MLRVLHIGKFFPPASGGIENFLYDLTKYQSLAGLKVSVLAHHHHRITRITRRTNKFGIDIYETPYWKTLMYAPLPPISPSILLDVIKKEKPDVIHAHLPNLSAFTLLWKNIKIPILLHWHSDVIPTSNDKMLGAAYSFYKIFEKALIEKARRIIVTSRPYLYSSIPLKHYREKCSVVPLGIDPERLKTKDRAFEKSGKFLVCSAGRFTYYKGFEYLIKAVALVPGVSLIISGDGKLRSKLKDLIFKKGLENRVKLPGELPSDALFSLMKNCDLFCLPSIERTEAFGLVLLEAMYFGRPLITSRIEGSGISWVNKDKETGLQVPPKDEKALAEAINFMFFNPAVRKAYGINAKKRVEKLFHIRKICNQIENIYEEIRQK